MSICYEQKIFRNWLEINYLFINLILYKLCSQVTKSVMIASSYSPLIKKSFLRTSSVQRIKNEMWKKASKGHENKIACRGSDDPSPAPSNPVVFANIMTPEFFDNFAHKRNTTLPYLIRMHVTMSFRQNLTRIFSVLLVWTMKTKWMYSISAVIFKRLMRFIFNWWITASSAGSSVPVADWFDFFVQVSIMAF
jgi:hypothetical protein